MAGWHHIASTEDTAVEQCIENTAVEEHIGDTAVEQYTGNTEDSLGIQQIASY
jgi:hypothetical protein